MTKNFSVSVIIPVYNAERFLKDAVLSALAIDCVKEVLLIEDNSPDNCLEICETFSKNYSKVKLYRHPNGENRGAAASRNLGIEKATANFISFLDADDYYLPNRFEEGNVLFLKDPEIDFTFGAVQYEADYNAKNGRFKSMKIPQGTERDLFDMLMLQTFGFFHTNAVTIKKNSLQKNGFRLRFNENLRLHQDAELWLRLAFHLSGKAEPSVNPIAIVRQHDLNRITHMNDESVFKYWDAVREYFTHMNISKKQRLLIEAYCNLRKNNIEHSIMSRIKNFGTKIKIKALRNTSLFDGK